MIGILLQAVEHWFLLSVHLSFGGTLPPDRGHDPIVPADLPKPGQLCKKIAT